MCDFVVIIINIPQEIMICHLSSRKVGFLSSTLNPEPFNLEHLQAQHIVIIR
jgi:hypothetical protein